MRRPVLPGDVASVARALLFADARQRQALCARIFRGAGMAQRHCGQCGRLHPKWGDGSLSAAARRFALADEPAYDEPEYLQCLLLVLTELSRRLHH